MIAAIDALLARDLPMQIALRVPEGFAYYALFPETHAAAARALVREYRPPRVCVIGLSSGTTLAAVVHAAVESCACPVWSCTVRPGGHPFARRVRLDAAFTARLHAEASSGACFAVVDEGPGLSGSSFASVADALESIGVDPDRIVFLPAWDPATDRLANMTARRAWTAHRRIHVDAAAPGVTPEAIFGAQHPVDDSAGRWRAALYASSAEWPIVPPEHERWKVRLPREGRLLKFVGLGRFGEAARRRARVLAELGLGLEPGDLRQGFLDLPFVAGDPWTPADGDPVIVGRYVARVAAASPPPPLSTPNRSSR